MQTRNQLLQIFRVNRELASDVAHGVVEEQAEDLLQRAIMHHVSCRLGGDRFQSDGNVPMRIFYHQVKVHVFIRDIKEGKRGGKNEDVHCR